jgi:glyoxylate/hydroxypyruvate reductase A
MVLLFKSEAMPEAWVDALQSLAPGLEVRVWPDWGAPAEADFALVWKPPKGELAKYPNLRVIFSIGAGIDHLASDPELPRHIPLVRMVDPSLTAGMTEYVVMSVLHHHRFMLDYTGHGPGGAGRRRARQARGLRFRPGRLEPSPQGDPRRRHLPGP